MMPEVKNSENRFLKIIKNNSDKPVHKTSSSATSSASSSQTSSHPFPLSSFPSRKRAHFITLSTRSTNSRQSLPASSPTTSSVPLSSSTPPPLPQPSSSSSSSSSSIIKSPLSKVQTSSTTTINTVVIKSSSHHHQSTEATDIHSDETRVSCREEQKNNQHLLRNSIDCNNTSKSTKRFFQRNSREIGINGNVSEKNTSPNEPASDLSQIKQDELKTDNVEVVNGNNLKVANDAAPSPVEKTVKCKNEDYGNHCIRSTEPIVEAEDVECKRGKYDANECIKNQNSFLKIEETTESISEVLKQESNDNEIRNFSKCQLAISSCRGKSNFEGTEDVNTRLVEDDQNCNLVTELCSDGFTLNDLKMEYEKVVASISKGEAMLRIINKKIGAFKFKKNQLEDLLTKFNPGPKTKKFTLNKFEDQNEIKFVSLLNSEGLRSNKLKRSHDCPRSKKLNEKLINKELDSESPSEELLTSDEKSIRPSPAHQHKFKMELLVHKQLIGCLPPEAHLCKTDLSACTYLVCRRKVTD